MGLFKDRSREVTLKERISINRAASERLRIKWASDREEIFDELLEIEYFQELSMSEFTDFLSLTAYILLVTIADGETFSFATLPPEHYKKLIEKCEKRAEAFESESIVTRAKMLMEILQPGLLGNSHMENLIKTMATDFLSKNPNWLDAYGY